MIAEAVVEAVEVHQEVAEPQEDVVVPEQRAAQRLSL